MTSIHSNSARRWALALAVLAGLSPGVRAGDSEDAPAATFDLTLRRRVAVEDGRFKTRHEAAQWKAGETAVIVCDMWDLHHCLNATRRVGELAPRLNRLVAEARRRGALIIHAPSSCMEFYASHPARQRARQAPRADNLPAEIDSWCHQIPSESSVKFPVDHSDGGCDSTGKPQEEWSKKLASMGRDPGAPWKRQIEAIEIRDEDVISDSGVEIWNVLEARGIRNVALVGVHTNMCVLGRPFGLRQMARNGKRTALVRDMTDTMYNPESWPHVPHFRGTDRVVEHIEKLVCPTITSGQILDDGELFRFPADRDNPHIVFVVGEREYDTEKTLPDFARTVLEPRGAMCTFVHASEEDPNDFPGLPILTQADLLFLSVRRRALTRQQLGLIKEHLETGKPLVGIRTASHAFGRDPQDERRVAWHEFDVEVLGAKYEGHYSNKPRKGTRTVVQVVESASDHPIVDGVRRDAFPVTTHLYKTRNPGPHFEPLMVGRLEGTETAEMVAWTNDYNGARVFYTSLGGVDDFENPAFVRLLLNGVYWALERDVSELLPQAAEGNSAKSE